MAETLQTITEAIEKIDNGNRRVFLRLQLGTIAVGTYGRLKIDRGHSGEAQGICVSTGDGCATFEFSDIKALTEYGGYTEVELKSGNGAAIND
jgi:hypothetical protein